MDGQTTAAARGEGLSHNPISLENIDDCFTYQQPDAEQLQEFEVVREHLTKAGRAILSACPRSHQRDLALEKLVEARMLANASIAHRGRF